MNVEQLKADLIEKAKANYFGLNITDTSIFFREYDNVFEILGLVPDPTIDEKDFFEREILVPKKWVTLNTVTLGELNGY